MPQLVDIIMFLLGVVVVFVGAMIAVSEVVGGDLSTKQLVAIVCGIFICVPVAYLTMAILLGIG